MHKLLTGLFSSTLILASAGAAAQTCPSGAVYDTSVGVFNSTDPSPAVQVPTLYGIGGSGISNNDSFSACREPGVELASRIDARSAGSITPEAGTFTYIAPQGDAGGGEALWNYTGHLDFAYAYGTGVAPLELGTNEIAVQIDCDPLVGVVNGPLLDTGAIGGIIGDVLLPPLQLLQLSQNLGFAGVCDSYGGFDPTADGSYEFTAVVYDAAGAVVAASSATALVGTPPVAATYSVGGAVLGLSGSVTLQNNGGDDLTMNADGSFTFATEISDGGAYAVTVSVQPTGQTCAVTNGSGTIATADVTDVSVNCTDEAPPVQPPAPGTPPQHVPTMSAWALMALSMMLGLVVFFRRKLLS